MKNDKNFNNDLKLIFKVLFYLFIAVIPIILLVLEINLFFDPLLQDSQYSYKTQSINLKELISSPVLWGVVVGSIVFACFLLKSDEQMNTTIENIKKDNARSKRNGC